MSFFFLSPCLCDFFACPKKVIMRGLYFLCVVAKFQSLQELWATHGATESDERLTFGRIWFLCASIQSCAKNAPWLQLFCNKTCGPPRPKKRKWDEVVALCLRNLACVSVLQQMCIQSKTSSFNEEPQWGGSKWMHDKAEQIDRLISAFTCVVAAACLTTQQLIVHDWYLCVPFPPPIPQPSVILCQDVAVRLTGIQSVTPRYLHGNNKMII